MVKNGLCQQRSNIPWSLLLAPILMVWSWAGTAQPAGGALDPSLQAEPGPKAAAPAVKAKKAPPRGAAKQPATKKAGSVPVVAAPQRNLEVVGHRDPFYIPPPPVPGRGGEEEITGPLPPGTRGLVISRLKLEGIVRLDTTKAMIAVVDTSANRAYFLRENDAVYNGVVSKITYDSVYFTENVLDSSGRTVTREVVKRLSQGPGEGR